MKIPQNPMMIYPAGIAAGGWNLGLDYKFIKPQPGGCFTELKLDHLYKPSGQGVGL
jgi:hypothetical protein